jgi:hypothetical protein
LKFKPGDPIDHDLCTALKHEFLRCEDAFRDCEVYVRKTAASSSQTEDFLIAYKAYNAYSRFIHHLYEFILGAIARETGDTSQLEATEAEQHIAAHAQRILTGRRQAILEGTAPVWENDISYYPEKIPADFAKAFRQFRNQSFGHVTHRRSTISMSDFYAKYHKYVHMLYWNCRGSWGLREGDFPDLKEITKFSFLIKSSPPRPKTSDE